MNQQSLAVRGCGHRPSSHPQEIFHRAAGYPHAPPCSTVSSTCKSQGCRSIDPQDPSVTLKDVGKSDEQIAIARQHAEAATSIVARAQLEPGYELDGTDLGASLVVLLDAIVTCLTTVAAPVNPKGR